MRRPRILVGLTALITMAGAATAVGGSAQAATSTASASSKMSVVAWHLSNPRGLAFANGKVYVAQGGRANDANCLTDPGGNTTCAGLTGSIGVVKKGGGVDILVSGLISVGGPGGELGREGFGRVDSLGGGQDRTVILLRH